MDLAARQMEPDMTGLSEPKPYYRNERLLPLLIVSQIKVGFGIGRNLKMT